MLQHRGGGDSVVDEGYLNDNQEQQISSSREHIRASEIPSFPMMGMTVPQEQSMAGHTNRSDSRNRYRRRSRRRSCSFDDLLPVPKISLRPRYYRPMGRNMQELHLPRPLPPSFELELPRQLPPSPISRKRSHHFRSYTFDGNDTAGLLNDLPPVSSPPVNATFVMSHFNQALPQASHFSPSNCSMDSPRSSFARPIPQRHLTPGVPTPVPSIATTNGVGTICSSSTSAFESASSTFAPSRQGDSATAGSFESLLDSNMLQVDRWPYNASTLHQSFNTQESGEAYPSEVRVTGGIQNRESSTYDLLDSPKSSGSDDIEALMHSATCPATGQSTNDACDASV